MRSTAISALVALASAALVTANDELTAKFVPTTIKAPFLEQFTEDWSDRWTPSEATKKTPVGGETFSYVGKWEVEAHLDPTVEGEKGLVAKTKAGHHAISAPLLKPVGIKDQPVVIQYEAKFQKGGNCGGGYLKLLEEGYQSYGEFDDKTPWVVMFGADMTCPGSKVHFIFRHRNPKTGEFEEKHLQAAPTPSIGKETKLYTLVVHPDNTFDLSIDGESVKTGNLLEDFDPAVNPAKEIDDPEDKKPEDWVDESKIADPEATKPEDWDEDAPYEILDEEAEKPEGWLDDEPDMVVDPEAQKPEEWEDEEDGEWIAASIRNPKCDEAPGCGEWKRPMTANPAYKGKWYPPMIDNPAYKGIWAPRKIPNPDYFEDKEPAKSLKRIGGVGIEIWTMTEDILFDNIYVGHSVEDAKALAAATFDIRKPLEAAKSAIPDVEEEPATIDWKADPVAFIRQKVFAFIDAAKVDPVEAFKAAPETGAVLVGAILTLFGMLGAVFGLVGGQQGGVTKSSKKTDAPTPDDKKKTETAPVAPAGGEKTEAPVKKRK
ncbi:Calreticulin-domain-containing protein [Hysterangium stoloniferum]|nr:Calreticulin-domain-containing protein [Hysterangium stoloniferum]